MIALLIVLTFVVAILIDHLLLRQPVLIAEEANPAAERPRLLPSIVGGFAVPENLKYHPGHTWAAAETANLVRVGIDDFAAKVAGDIDSIDVPTRGQWIRQGQKLISMHRGGRNIEIVSPIEGTVVDVNDAALQQPKLAHDDPYGDGWLVQVNSPDAKTNFRNLLSGNLARRWMEDAAARLRAMIPATAGAFAQDGGIVTTNLLDQIPENDWPKAAKELFLTA